ncbi:hypothetical protein J6590_027567 [Homalodisca vitripennis]|nr:hypothetical protein J6590_027567 [Homalodisca vitripennis]
MKVSLRREPAFRLVLVMKLSSPVSEALVEMRNSQFTSCPLFHLAKCFGFFPMHSLQFTSLCSLWNLTSYTSVLDLETCSSEEVKEIGEEEPQNELLPSF